MQIANTELRTLYMDREIDLASSAEVLDVAVSAVFRSSWDGPSSFSADFGFDLVICTACVDVLWLRGFGNIAVEFVGGNQLTLALVPCCKDFRRGSTPEDARMD